MKKLLLIVLILAICVLAFPQGVLAFSGSSGTVTVSGEYKPLALAFDAGTLDASGNHGNLDWKLVVNTNNDRAAGIYLDVTSTRTWQITAYDQGGVDTGHKYGYMFGSGHSLLFPFQMQVGGTGGNLGSLGPVAGDAANPTSILIGGPDSQKQTDNSAIRQWIAPGDFGSSTGYSMVLFFAIAEDPSLP